MKKINLKKFVDLKGIQLEAISDVTGIDIVILENMYTEGVFNGDELGVNSLTILMQTLDIININDLVPSIKNS